MAASTTRRATGPTTSTTGNAIAHAASHDAMAVLGKMRELGVLASTAGGDVIRLAPPLNVTRAECDRALEALRTAVVTTPPKA